MAIGERAISQYVKRKFSEIAKSLDGARDTIEVGIALRHLRTQDKELKFLKKRPALAIKAWEVGKPNFSRLLTRGVRRTFPAK